MPKLKTKRSAAKRFRIQGSGGIKRTKAFLRHILTKKTTKRKRNMRGTVRCTRATCVPCARCFPTVKETSHAKSQTWGRSARPSQESNGPGQGVPRPSRQRLPHRQGGGDEGGPVCLSRPKDAQA